MAELASAARSVAFLSDDWWRALVRSDEDEVRIHGDPAEDPYLVLDLAAQSATKDLPIERDSLVLLRDTQPQLQDVWPERARDRFVETLLAGDPLIGVFEALDHFDVLVRILPEWEPNRSRPQRNAYHRFTVDRHLCETAANAAALAARVSRPDLLVVGALLHDIGKGYPGDHTEVGLGLVRTIAERMGFPAGDVELLVGMVEHHLLLPDVATRRDLDDEATIRAVVGAVGSPLLLDLLAALTEADSLATGPLAWSPWKADLVSTLAQRARHLIGGGDWETLPTRLFPTDEQYPLMALGETVVVGDASELTVVTADRPGVFSRVAGALSLVGLDVLSASAYSTPAMALSVFRVKPREGRDIDIDEISDLVERVLAGKVALGARLEDKARMYQRRALAAEPASTSVLFDNELTIDATVIEVRCEDRVGVLYRITKALAEMDLDIRSAKVQTLGHEVVDSFYVRDGEDSKLGAEVQAEVERALLHVLGQ